jgi:2-polyprenyl-6-methoxyphenol hydroxylase-like FAD-dependent oxidoreductase
MLGQAGYRVVLIDVHPVYPSDFRVEKIAGDQVTMLRRLGFLDVIASGATRVDEIINAAFGRVLDRTVGEHYSIVYADIVKIARGQIPPQVTFLIGRVAEIKTSPDRQRITVTSGGVIEARLVVLATGQGDFLRQKLGIVRRVNFPKHSLSFGFTVQLASAPLGFSALTYYGEHPRDRIDYLTLLPLGSALRANLFTFCDHRDPWARAFRHDPKGMLLQILPGLANFLPEFEVIGSAQLFVMDLSVVENHVRDGTVLIGDAFQTSCPAAGTGVSRLLVDVDRLCRNHIPNWLRTPGMGVEKIAQFYADPVKRAADQRARLSSCYRRSLTIDQSPYWELRRRQLILRRRMVAWISDCLSRCTPYTRGHKGWPRRSSHASGVVVGVKKVR